jgi:hypothetical protein
LELLDFAGVAADNYLRILFTNEIYAVSELLLDDRNTRRKIGWKEYQKQKAERLVERTRELDAESFDAFLNQCADVLRFENDSQSEYQIQNSVGGVLAQLAERDHVFYEVVLGRYLRAGNRLRLGPWALVDKLVARSGPDRAYEMLSAGDYSGRKSWLFGYFTAIPANSTTPEQLEKLYELYETSCAQDLHRDFDFLLKFLPVDGDVVLRVTRELVAKAVADSAMGFALCGLFDGPSQVVGKLSEIFAGNVGLLKQAYLAACMADRHMDYDGHSYSYLEMFFTNREGHEDAQMLRERQDAFLDRMIESRHAEGEVMQLLFSAIANFSEPRRRARIQAFLRHNRDLTPSVHSR